MFTDQSNEASIKVGRSLETIATDIWRRNMKEKILTCIQCENQFILSTAEYERLHYRGFTIPKRCPECRKRKSKNNLEINVDWTHKRRKRHGRGSEKHFETTEL